MAQATNPSFHWYNDQSINSPISDTTGKVINREVDRLLSIYQTWLNDISVPIHIVMYDNLIANLREEIVKILRFLNCDVTEFQVQCVLRHSEGENHRKKHIPNTTQFYSSAQKEMLRKHKAEMEQLIAERTCLEQKLAVLNTRNK